MLEDVLDDFCTAEHARDAYGVVVDLDTDTVDVRATEAASRGLCFGTCADDFRW